MAIKRKAAKKKITAKPKNPPALMNPMIGGLPQDIQPAYPLTVTQREHFDEIIREMHRNDMLSSIDKFYATNAAVIMDKIISAKEHLDITGLTQTFDTGAKNISAELSAWKTLMGEWEKCVQNLGLSPKARAVIMKKPAGKAKVASDKDSTPRGLTVPR
jgi:phage terminase small subunit